MQWSPDGELHLSFNSGKKTSACINDGLPYMDWNDFEPTRSALVESHKAGRRAVSSFVGSINAPSAGEEAIRDQKVKEE